MKVLMFGWEYPPYNSGGLGVACQGLARALAQRGIDLIFILPKKIDISVDGFKVIFANNPNINLCAFNSLLVPYITSKSYKLLRSGMVNSGWYGLTLFEEVERYAEVAREIAKREKFDIIHAHDWLSFGAGIAAKEVSGKPLVVHVHATEVDRTAGKVNKYIYEREQEGLEIADKVISVSGFTKKTLLEHYALPPEKVEVVHNGIDSANYDLKVGEELGLCEFKKLGYKIVLFVGRITIMKGPDYFVKAAKKVLEYRPKVLFIIAGSGDMEEQIMREVASLGISDKFIFPGFLRGRQLSEVFKAADLFVMPSVSEPFGLTPLESLLHGTPAIVSKQSGVSEVLNHVFKVDFWDIDEMADKILSLLEHEPLWSVMAENGSKEASLCTWDKSVEKCIQIYNSL